MTKGVTTRWGAVLVLGLSVMAGQASALGTVFTYQGQLEHSGIAANDTCDFQFSLFDAVSVGNQVGTTQTVTPVSISDGLFTVQLDFGSSAFDGNDRWLQIAVRCPAGSGSYTTLSPRQPLTAAPYALYAPSAGTAADLNCSGCLSATDLANGAVTDQKVASGIAYSKLTGAPTALPPNGPAGGSLSDTYPNPSLAANSVATTQIQNAAVTLAKLNPSGAATGQSPIWNGSTVVWGNPTAGPTLPFEGSLSSNGPGFSVTQNGFGLGLQGIATATSGAPTGVYGQSDAPAGIGVSGASAGDGVHGVSSSLTGLHYGVLGRSVSNAFAAAGVRGEATALSGQVIGVEGVAPNSPQGAGVVGRGTKSVGGYFENTANTAAAFATNFSATGSNAYGVYGEARSNDFRSAGVHGRQLSNSGQVIGVEGVATDSPIGTGVAGRGGAVGGYFENSASDNAAVYGNSPNGTGVVGRGGATGGYFEGSGPPTTALALNNGGIRVLGAGEGTPTAVFVHVVHDGSQPGFPNNRCGPDSQVTIIDNPYANGHPEAILLVTPRYHQSESSLTPSFLSYGDNLLNCPNNRWLVAFYQGTGLPDGLRLNVAVINP